MRKNGKSVERIRVRGWNDKRLFDHSPCLSNPFTIAIDILPAPMKPILQLFVSMLISGKSIVLAVELRWVFWKDTAFAIVRTVELKGRKKFPKIPKLLDGGQLKNNNEPGG